MNTQTTEPDTASTFSMVELLSKISRADKSLLLKIRHLLRDIPGSHYLNVSQVCHLLDVSKATVYRMVRDGKIHPIPLDTRVMIFAPGEIEDYLCRTYPWFKKKGGEV